MEKLPYFTKTFLEKREAHMYSAENTSKSRQAFNKAVLLSAGVASAIELGVLGLGLGEESQYMKKVSQAVDKKLSTQKDPSRSYSISA
ncbi:hypothetical protein [Micavibrio aeruginosavorus]|uniref:hypothetical protein n=1 Tax=Micavibrio aeruginosavorus TaxID=349221 RepID=UPI00034CFE8A|nr:hypothetical protein [Micavibrio aeruginosavorus]